MQTFAEKCKNKHIYTRVKGDVVRKYLIAISSRQLYIVECKFVTRFFPRKVILYYKVILY